ncbi:MULTISPECIES: OmpH family outer membrane protein [Paracoccaceae]|jgi:Skp family chaperone for outer membrane proteins|uniref:OmpH family outer membrane protein n=1 Tax=Rhodobacterales TaxID=204455 RepID=UPI001AFE4C13|nr:OmpH family outer membrane protein [Boseongicola sp. H5]MBO6603587.1 OmpH family outer membrane protein [Roseicyclus sp.]MBO6626718.1 OmpH family outer membrane protein [Roseicyclus sp.]MBO6924061.1 OmpH family outer membrane protein [Roseicyclus sp.]
MALWRSRPWLSATLAVALMLFAEGPAGAPALAQQLSAPSVPTPAPEGILVLNQDRLFSTSLYGARVQRELEAAGERLAAENRQIEAQLTEEELRLTEQRPQMDPVAFRILAEEFDTRVGEIRAAQEAKAQSLSDQADDARQRFFELSFPILLELVRERGAAVIMDNRAVLLSAESVDITADALARVNAEIGDGGDAVLLPLPDPSPPLPRPAPEASSPQTDP